MAAERLKEADAVLLTAQMVRFSGNLFIGKGSPTFITRLNWNSIHCEPWEYQEAYTVKALSAAAAVAAGAEVVLASLVLQTGDEAHDAENVQVFSALAEEAAVLGVPLIGEVFPMGGLRSRPAEFHDYVKKMCRIIAELGADAIKTFYTGERFARWLRAHPYRSLPSGQKRRLARSTRWSWRTNPLKPERAGWSSDATSSRPMIRLLSCAA